jgi:XRE family transcriptional regulator, regulator of sulfur utilization
MEESSATLSTGIRLDALGDHIRQQRLQRHVTLEQLSEKSSVSRSMLSAVERGEKIPSVLILDRIATALGTSIARLLGEERRERVIVLRHDQQDVAADPSGWERRILSPVLPNIEFELMRTAIGPGVDAGTFLPHGPGSREYVAIERGTLELTLDGVTYRLERGDSVYYAGNCLHAFRNPDSQEPCEYYLAMDVTGYPETPAHRKAGS